MPTRESGIITITITGPGSLDLVLSDRLRERFGLRHAVVSELCGRTPQRLRHLRAERQAADERGEPHPFPAEFIAGHWLREEAEAYAATLRGNG